MNRESPQRLDAARGDVECMLGLSSGRYTRPNGTLWFMVAGAITAAAYWVMSMDPQQSFCAMMFRCWTNGAVMLFTTWCLLILVNKFQKTRIQWRALRSAGLFPRRADWVLSPATAGEVLQGIRERADRPRDFLLFNRLTMALANLGNIGEVRDVGAVLESQADADGSTVDSSYTGIRALIWTIPVLGFIGTVVGLSDAIGSFQGVLGSEQAADSIRERLTPVVLGLRTAFETTLVALVAAVAVQLITTWVYRGEEDLLDACTQYCNDNVISRLRLTDL